MTALSSVDHRNGPKHASELFPTKMHKRFVFASENIKCVTKLSVRLGDHRQIVKVQINDRLAHCLRCSQATCTIHTYVCANIAALSAF